MTAGGVIPTISDDRVFLHVSCVLGPEFEYLIGPPFAVCMVVAVSWFVHGFCCRSVVL